MFPIKKKHNVKKEYAEKEKENHSTTFLVIEDCMLLDGGVLYGFTGQRLHRLNVQPVKCPTEFGK